MTQKYIVNVEGAVFKGDKWLIVERSSKEEHAGGLLSFIGGKVEVEGAGNSVLEETLKREILEEVGVEIDGVIKYVKSNTFSIGEKSVLNIVFLCSYKSGEPKALDPEEVANVSWMGVKELLAHQNCPSWTKESLEKAEQMRLLTN